jgi:transposase
MDLTDEQWAVVAPHLPQRTRRRGRPRRDDRAILTGILWLMLTCPTAIRPTRPATGAFRSGCSTAPWNAACVASWLTSKNAVS